MDVEKIREGKREIVILAIAKGPRCTELHPRRRMRNVPTGAHIPIMQPRRLVTVALRLIAIAIGWHGALGCPSPTQGPTELIHADNISFLKVRYQTGFTL